MNTLLVRSHFLKLSDNFFQNIKRFSVKLNENISELQKPFQSDKLKRKRVVNTDSKINREFLQYFGEEDKELIFKSFPDKTLKRKFKSPDHLYLADRKCAKTIAGFLTAHNTDEKPIVEVNPGIGLLTNELIENTGSKLILYELHDIFLPNLNVLNEKTGNDRITIKSLDFLGLWRLQFLDKMDNGNRIADALLGLPKKEWESDTNFKLFANVGTITFIKHLINSIVFQTSLLSYGRCEMFLCLPPPLYMHLTCSNTAGYLLYRATTILFQLFFEHQLLAKLPRKSFLPWQNDYKLSPHLKLTKFNLVDPDLIYLVKITPRQDLYKYIHPDRMQALWFFIKQHFISRKNRVIPTLERWVPGCGPRLIVNTSNAQKGKILDPNYNREFLPIFSEPSKTLSTHDFFEQMNIFTEFGDLSPTETLTIFDQFVQWPEYEQSPFLTSIENNLMKLEHSPVDNVDGLELHEQDDEFSKGAVNIGDKKLET